jgi:hypothetical protein
MPTRAESFGVSRVQIFDRTASTLQTKGRGLVIVAGPWMRCNLFAAMSAVTSEVPDNAK